MQRTEIEIDKRYPERVRLYVMSWERLKEADFYSLAY